MQYMLLIYQEEKAVPDAEREQCYRDSAEFARRLSAKGQFVAAAPLHPASTATSVRVRDGKPLITDGPFIETREQLGGFFIVEAADLDEALDIARRLPPAKWGGVEVRPVIAVPGLPENSTRTVDFAGSRATE